MRWNCIEKKLHVYKLKKSSETEENVENRKNRKDLKTKKKEETWKKNTKEIPKEIVKRRK